MIIIDATNATLGRLASYAAKQALKGNEIAIVNCKNTIITGNKESILNKYKKSRARGSSSLKGPFFPKTPERLLKRTIRGMLPYKKDRGLNALKKIKCYNTMPPEFETKKKILAGKEKKTNTITLSQLNSEL